MVATSRLGGAPALERLDTWGSCQPLCHGGCAMDVILTPGAGLDVPQKAVVACRVTPDPTGQQAAGIVAVQTCGTMTCDVLALADWLAAAGITPVAMESTGE